MFNVLVILGARREAIKMASVISELKKYPEQIKTTVCVTGKNKDALEKLLGVLNIAPDISLNITGEDRSPEDTISSVLFTLKDLFQKEKYDLLLVNGNSTTNMAVALAAFYNNVKVAHVASGSSNLNRSGLLNEGINKKVINSVSHFCFAETEKTKQGLAREGIDDGSITVTGNTGIDTLLEFKEKEYKIEGSVFENIPFKTTTIVLVTTHREETLAKEPLGNICRAIKELANTHKDVHFVYPLSLEPEAQECVHSALDNIENVSIMKPLLYQPFVFIMKYSFIILSDSSTIQEEAPSLHVPVLVLRDETDKPEVLEAKVAKLVGTDPEKIIAATTELLESIRAYRAMANSPNPYGNGTAADKIIERILKEI